MSLTLSSSDTLNAKAGTATAITYTLLGDAIVSGVDTFKQLGQGQLTTSASTPIYPATASTQTIIREIQLANTTGLDVLGVTFYMDGSTGTNQISAGFTIPANGSASYRDGLFTIYSATGLPINTSSVTLTGDVTGSGSGSIVTTLAIVNASPGTTGSATQASIIAVNGKGLVTSNTNVTVTPAVGSVTGLGTGVATALSNNVGSAGAPVTFNGAGGTPSSVTLTNGSGLPTTGLTGTLQAAQEPAHTGDVTNTAGSLALALKNTGPGVTGPFGSASTTPVVTIDAQGRTTGLTSATITPAAIGAPSGSGTSSGTNTGDQTITLTGDTTGSGTGSFATVNARIQGQPVSSTTPAVGQVLEYGPSSTWTPSTMYFNVISFGADPTGTSSSYTAIQAAINAAQIAGYTGNSGGIVWFPPGRYLIGTTLTVTGGNITLMGAGGGASADFGNYAANMASHIVPQSAIKAVVVSPVLTNGLNGVPNYGFKWKGLAVDNYANAGTFGLQMISCQNFDIDDFYAINSTSVGIDFNTLPASFLNGAVTLPLSGATVTVNSTAASGTGPAFNANTNTAGSFCLIAGAGSTTPGQVVNVTYTGGTATTFTGCTATGTGTFATATSFARILPGAQDCTRGRIGQVNLRQVDGGGASGHAIQLNGDGAGIGNTCLNNFLGPIKIFHVNGNGINDINSDTNWFDVGTIARPSGSGIGAMIGAGTTNAFASRNNIFNSFSFGAGGLTARGTPTATFPSGPTRVMNYQVANGEALPTVEAGALLDVNFNGAFKVGNLTAPSVTGQAMTAAALNIVTGTKFVVPPQGFQVGTHLVFYVPMIKTAVGVSWLYNIRYGTGAVGTGAILQTITYTATAAIDGGILEVHCIITALGTGTSATNTGYAKLHHDLAATGLATGVTVPASDATSPAGFIYTRPTFAGFDSTLPQTGVPQFVFIEINPVTAATVQTIEPGAQAFCLAQSNL